MSTPRKRTPKTSTDRPQIILPALRTFRVVMAAGGDDLIHAHHVLIGDNGDLIFQDVLESMGQILQHTRQAYASGVWASFREETIATSADPQ